MKNNLRAFVYLFFVWVLSCLWACRRQEVPAHVAYIPAQAKLVLSLDLRRIVSKSLSLEAWVDTSNLKGLGMPQEQAQHTRQQLQLLFNSGIDFANTCYLFSNSPEQDIYLLLPIDNFKKWQKNISDPTFWQVLNPEGGVPAIKQTEKGIFTSEIPAWKARMCWNEQVLLLYFPLVSATYSQRSDAQVYAQMVAYLKNTQKEQQLYYAQADFYDLLKQKHDLLLWAHLPSANELADRLPAQYLPGDLLSDESFFAALLRFEKGIVDMEGFFFPSDSLKRRIVSYYASSLHKDLLFTPFNKPKAALLLALSKEAVGEILKEAGLVTSDASLRRELGISAQEIAEMWDGQLSIVLRSLVGIPEVAATVGIANTEIYEKMMKHLVQTGKLQKKANDTYTLFNLLHAFRKGNFLHVGVGLEDIWKDQDKLPADWYDKASHASSFFAVEFGLLNDLASQSLLSNDQARCISQYADKLLIWDNTHQSSDRIHVFARLHFHQRNRNALILLFKLIEEVRKCSRSEADVLASNNQSSVKAPAASSH